MFKLSANHFAVWWMIDWFLVSFAGLDGECRHHLLLLVALALHQQLALPAEAPHLLHHAQVHVHRHPHSTAQQLFTLGSTMTFIHTFFMPVAKYFPRSLFEYLPRGRQYVIFRAWDTGVRPVYSLHAFGDWLHGQIFLSDGSYFLHDFIAPSLQDIKTEQPRK